MRIIFVLTLFSHSISSFNILKTNKNTANFTVAYIEEDIYIDKGDKEINNFMKEFFSVALYGIAVLYVLVVLFATSFFVWSNLVAEFSFNYRFYIIIPLGLVMLFLMIDYYLKKEKNKNDKMKFLLYLFFTPCIFPLISILIFGIFNDNYILALGVYIPVGLIGAILFFIVNYFLEKNLSFSKKNLMAIKLISIISVFLIATTIYLLIEYGEIIKPLKNILDIESDS
jgi:hypothetical protein